jgi:hypothetical protein
MTPDVMARIDAIMGNTPPAPQRFLRS